MTVIGINRNQNKTVVINNYYGNQGMGRCMGGGGPMGMGGMGGQMNPMQMMMQMMQMMMKMMMTMMGGNSSQCMQGQFPGMMGGMPGMMGGMPGMMGGMPGMMGGMPGMGGMMGMNMGNCLGNFMGMPGGGAGAYAGPGGAGAYAGPGGATAANPNQQITDIGGTNASKQQVGNMLKQAAAKYGIPLNILQAVAWKESGWNAKAVGDHGNSHGVMQIYRKAHPKAYQGASNVGNNTAKNIDYGAKLLKTLYNKYKSWPMAVKRYNGSGPMADRYSNRVMALSSQQPWRNQGLA